MIELIVKDTTPEHSLAHVRISAMRGRPHNGRNIQTIEIGSHVCTNTITSVAKDNIVWIERTQY